LYHYYPIDLLKLGEKVVKKKELFAKYDFIDYKYGATICGITSQQQRYRLHAQHISSTASFYKLSTK
jgi:hypothetical protein